MPLRLFGGKGSGKVRTCPACEQEVAVTATFCPSCYMVFRPEGAADLREHLQGARVPSDVYLLRKMQAEDPNTGPVIRVPEELPAPPPAAPAASTCGTTVAEDVPSAPTPVAPSVPISASPAPLPDPPVAETPLLPLFPAAPPPAEAAISVEAPRSPSAPTPPVPPTQATPPSQDHGRSGGEPLLGFGVPLPPPTRSIEEAPALFVWMLEHDPIIPNNLERLQKIHAGVFRNRPADRLDYEQHILLQVADDLALHPTREAMDLHLMHLAAGYRRAGEAYHVAARREEHEADRALWQMASMASRLRMEAWVYQSRYGVPPVIAERGQPRTRRVTSDRVP
jgi:hypothetical protein